MVFVRYPPRPLVAVVLIAVSLLSPVNTPPLPSPGTVHVTPASRPTLPFLHPSRCATPRSLGKPGCLVTHHQV